MIRLELWESPLTSFLSLPSWIFVAGPPFAARGLSVFAGLTVFEVFCERLEVDAAALVEGASGPIETINSGSISITLLR